MAHLFGHEKPQGAEGEAPEEEKQEAPEVHEEPEVTEDANVCKPEVAKETQAAHVPVSAGIGGHYVIGDDGRRVLVKE